MKNIKLLEIMKTKLKENFNGLIVKIVLFGSRVDGTAREDSDYDVLVVVNKKIDWETGDSIRSVLYDLNIELDVFISVQIISEPELVTITGKQPFIQNAFETGMTA